MAGFKISGKDNTEVLLAGGGSKALSDFAMSTALSGYLPFTVHSSMSTDIPTDLSIGLHSIHRPGIEYSSVFVVKDYNNKYAQLYFHPTTAYTHRIYYRRGSESWYTIAYTSDIPTKVSQLTNDSGFLTSHLSLANYLPLSGGTLTGHLKISGTKDLSTAWDKGLIVGADGHDKVVLTYLASSTNGAVIGAHNSNLSAWALLNVAGTQIVFRNNETERMRLDASGNLGIGTTSPGLKLHVNGGLLAITNNNNTITIGSQNGEWAHITSSSRPFWFSTNAFFQGDVYPYTTNTYNLGNKNYAWNNIYANDITLKNITDWNSVALSENKIRLLSRSGSTAPTGAPGSYYSGLSIMTDYVGFLLAVYGGTDNKLYFRQMQDNGTWHGWYALLNSDNYSSYALPLSGNKEITASFYLKSSGVLIVQKLENTSNYGAPIVWYKGGTSQATYNPQIGHHNTGDTNGSITILPYTTETAPWGGTVGLYIGKNTLKWENKTLIHSGNISSYAITSHQSLANYVTLNGDQTITGAKTFNVGKWKLAGNENNEIYNIHFSNGTYYKYDNSAVLGGGYGLKNSLVFRWFDDYWAIGNIRSGGVNTLGFGISLLSSDGAHLLDRFRVDKDGAGYLNGSRIITTGNISSYALTGWRTADALGAGGAPITTSVSSTRITDSYYVLATTSSGSCAWYKLPSNAFLNDNTNTTYSPGTGLSLDGTTFNAKLATNTLLGVTKYVKYYSAASVKRYNGDVGGSEVDTSTTSNIELAYASSTSGRFYPVLVDKNGFPFVNIPWSDTTYTFTTSGSGNVLTGVSTSGTTITFTKGNVSSGSTYGVASTSSSGLAPQLSLDSTNTIASQSTDYVLTYKSGTNTTPVWRKLPTNAFLNDNSWREIYIDGLSISSNSLNLKHGTNISLSRSGGDVTITASTQFLVVSSLPSGSSITSGVLYLVTT